MFDTISAQAIVIAACNFLARRRRQVNFLTPATRRQRTTEKFMAACFTDFSFLLFLRNRSIVRGHDCPFIGRGSRGSTASGFRFPRGDNLMETLAAGRIARRPTEVAAETRVGRSRRLGEVRHRLLASQSILRATRERDEGETRAEPRRESFEKRADGDDLVVNHVPHASFVAASAAVKKALAASSVWIIAQAASPLPMTGIARFRNASASNRVCAESES